MDWEGVYLLFKSDKNIHNVKDGKKELTKLVVDDWDGSRDSPEENFLKYRVRTRNIRMEFKELSHRIFCYIGHVQNYL